MNIKNIAFNKWFLDVRLVKDSKEYRKRETFTGTRKDAERLWYKLYERLENKASNELTCSLTLLTFSECIEYYLERTFIDSKSIHYFKTLKKDLGEVFITDLRERFDRYLLILRRTKSKNYGRLLSNQTINHYLKWAALGSGGRILIYTRIMSRECGMHEQRNPCP